MAITEIHELIARVESANNQYAMRYEPAFIPSEKAVKQCAALQGSYISMSTAKIICCTSWGMFQIMGENLYGLLNVKYPVGKFLCYPELQKKAFYSFLEVRKINYSLQELMNDSEKLDKFSVTYNGSKIYGQRLKGIYDASRSTI